MRYELTFFVNSDLKKQFFLTEKLFLFWQMLLKVKNFVSQNINSTEKRVQKSQCTFFSKIKQLHLL